MSKNIFDFTFAFILLILLSPLLIIISIIIKVSSFDDSVIFVQKRVGRYGNLFNIYKFRTMSKSNVCNTISFKGDPRVTKIGSFLRKYKLDELPELYNILKGDMSFVGPRPDVPGYLDKLIGENSLILNLKPGLTGPASLKYINEEKILSEVLDPIKYNDEVIFPDKVKINLEYYHNNNFLIDISIIYKTIFRIND